MPPRHPSYRGLTPLVLAIISGTEEISQCLIHSLCNLNQTVEDGKKRRERKEQLEFNHIKKSPEIRRNGDRNGCKCWGDVMTVSMSNVRFSFQIDNLIF